MEPDPFDPNLPGDEDYPPLPPLEEGRGSGGAYNPVGWWTVIGDTWVWITNPRAS
ncbi:MAG TPA: hypothetical protein VFY65_16605 [Longimicrobium sp.]|nr:hypothetical protein [Longimicrobium sp.]